MENPPKPPANILSTADLAAKLGLSRWAVSRALNGRPGISKSTVTRVAAAMREHNFEPDALARGLRGGTTGMVAVCLPRRLLDASKNDHFGLHPQSVIGGLNALYKRLEDNGLFGITVTADSAAREAESIRRVIGLRVDALVLIRPEYEDVVSIVSGLPRKTPCIAIDPVDDLPCTTVKFDRTQAARLALGHLNSLGHKRLALLGISPNCQSIKPFEEAAVALDMAWRNQVRVLHLDDIQTLPASSEGYGWALADTLLRRKLGVTALVAADDAIAAGALARLHHEQKTVPADFSLIGYGNLSLSGFSNPPIATVDPQINKLFEQAADTLGEQLRAAGQIETHGILINPLLLKRFSTGSPRVSP